MRRTFCQSKLRSSKQFMLYMLCAERKGNTVTVFSPRKIRKRDSRPGCVLLPDWVTSLWFFQVSHIFQLKLNMQTKSQKRTTTTKRAPERISLKSCPKTTEILCEPCHMRELMKNDLYSQRSRPKVPYCLCKYLHWSEYQICCINSCKKRSGTYILLIVTY